MKVTITTPTMLGTAVARRDSSSFSMALDAPPAAPHPVSSRVERGTLVDRRQRSLAPLGMTPCVGQRRGSPLPLHELAVVELAVEPVAVASDVLLHRHVEQRLE